jgi:hypothetical protein
MPLSQTLAFNCDPNILICIDAGRLEIAGMSDGGAAQRSNMFKKGDVLTHVNDTDVQRLKIHQVFVATNRVFLSSSCRRLA